MTVGQVSYVSRAITAEEYNAAIAQTPESCPLFSAGDLRSGRQVRERVRALLCVRALACAHRLVRESSCRT